MSKSKKNSKGKMNKIKNETDFHKITFSCSEHQSKEGTIICIKALDKKHFKQIGS